MKHYFIILIMTWASMLFILVMSWGMLLLGLNMGDFTILFPIMFAIGAIALLSRMRWYDEEIRKPLAETLEFGNVVEIMIHLQLFTIICGIMGLGLGIAAMTSFYPMGIKLMLKSLAVGHEEWHNFTKYTPMSVLSGSCFGLLFYSYLFADAREMKRLKKIVLIGGAIVFSILGLFFGADRYFFVIQD